MEDVSFSSGEIIFADEFATFATFGKTLRVIGRLRYNGSTKDGVSLVDAENDLCSVHLDTSLVVLKPTDFSNICSCIGEVTLDPKGFLLKPRVVTGMGDVSIMTIRAAVLSRRKALSNKF